MKFPLPIDFSETKEFLVEKLEQKRLSIEQVMYMFFEKPSKHILLLSIRL